MTHRAFPALLSALFAFGLLSTLGASQASAQSYNGSYRCNQAKVKRLMMNGVAGIIRKSSQKPWTTREMGGLPNPRLSKSIASGVHVKTGTLSGSRINTFVFSGGLFDTLKLYVERTSGSAGINTLICSFYVSKRGINLTGSHAPQLIQKRAIRNFASGGGMSKRLTSRRTRTSATYISTGGQRSRKLWVVIVENDATLPTASASFQVVARKN